MDPQQDEASAYRIQKTIRSSLRFKGTGLHTGSRVQIKLVPAPPNHGIVFHRVDTQPITTIRAHYESVVCTRMATTLGAVNEGKDTRISTVEHLLSALFALGITNLLVEVQGPEIPILDGSAQPFLEALIDVGLEAQSFTRSVFKVLRPIRVYQEGAVCELLPRNCLRITTSVDFPHPAIGLQTCALDVTPFTFLKEIGAARTFGFQSDVERLKAAGLARGASLDNVLAFSDKSVLNPEGMRFSDECVRHKILDAIGDLALCGSWIEGELVSFRGGHSVHLALLKSLKKHPGHWQLLPPEPSPSLRIAERSTLGQPLYLT